MTTELEPVSQQSPAPVRDDGGSWLLALIADVNADADLDPALRSATVAIAATLAQLAGRSGGIATVSAREIAETAGLPPVIAEVLPDAVERIESMGWLREQRPSRYEVRRSWRLRMPPRLDRVVAAGEQLRQHRVQIRRDQCPCLRGV